MIFVVNYHIVRTVHDLAMHPDHELFVMRFYDPVSITVKTSSSDVPCVGCDSVCIFVVDERNGFATGDKGAIEKFCGFSVDFYEH